MTEFDFFTVPDRSGTASAKWTLMKNAGYPIPKGTVPFSTADMEFVTPEPIKKHLVNAIETAGLGYGCTPDGYIDAVLDWQWNRHRYAPDAEELVTSPGVVTALYMAVRAFTKPGEGVIIQTPVYPPFYGAIRDNGRRVVAAPLIREGNTYKPDFDALRDAAKQPDVHLMILCSPHNPVGRVWTVEELKTVAEICEENGVFVVSDEIHNDLVQPGFTHTVFAELSDWACDNSLICTAPSKSFNIAGLQCSNLFVANKAKREALLDEFHRAAIYELNTLAMGACMVAYKECEPWLDAVINRIGANHDLAEVFLRRKLPEIRPCRLEGTYLDWWDCRDLKLDRQGLETLLKRDAAFYPDMGYRFGEEGEGFIRVNLACPSSVLLAALNRLRDAVDAVAE